MVIGTIWYGPLFGKKFIEATGMNKLSPEEQAKMQKGMAATYILQLIGSLVMFFVFAYYTKLSGHTGIMGGLNNAFWVWIGFIVPLRLSDALWGGKMTVFWIGVGYMFVTLAAAGAIIGAW